VPESEISQDNVAAIRTHINNLEQMVRFQISANRDNRVAVEERLSARSGLGELYLALENGPKSQVELAAALNVNQSTISRGLKELSDAGLVTPIEPGGGRRTTTYVWSPLEPLIGVSRIARAMLAKRSESEVTVEHIVRKASRISQPMHTDGDSTTATSIDDATR
jgi:DNA-binding transcriptional ArsR family regulator